MEKTEVFHKKPETALGYSVTNSVVEDPAGLFMGALWQWNFFSIWKIKLCLRLVCWNLVSDPIGVTVPTLCHPLLTLLDWKIHRRE